MNSVQDLWGLAGAELIVFGVFWLFIPQPSRPGRRGMRSLAWFNLCLGAGLVLIALRHRLPGLRTEGGADALIVLALALLWRCVEGPEGRRIEVQHLVLDGFEYSHLEHPAGLPGAEGNVAENEMHRVFNCGIGLVVVVAAADAEAAMAELKAQGEAVYRVGRVRARQGDEAQTVVV